MDEFLPLMATWRDEQNDGVKHYYFCEKMQKQKVFLCNPRKNKANTKKKKKKHFK
jgi:hypothetical protein